MRAFAAVAIFMPKKPESPENTPPVRNAKGMNGENEPDERQHAEHEEHTAEKDGDHGVLPFQKGVRAFADDRGDAARVLRFGHFHHLPRRKQREKQRQHGGAGHHQDRIFHFHFPLGGSAARRAPRFYDNTECAARQ